MTPRFFKAAAKKTLHHGLAAWFLYSSLSFFERFESNDTNLENIILKLFLTYGGIPALAAFGSEELMNRLFNIEIDSSLAVHNWLAGTVSALISALYNPADTLENSVPITYFTLAMLYHYYGCDEIIKLVPIENRPRPN
ncbi:MAG: hypothetical protein V4501_05710 [Pseudomonadota bacterium]